jgi:hypothetical protein
MKKVFKFSFVSHYYDNHYQFLSRMVEFVKDYYDGLILSPELNDLPNITDELVSDDESVIEFGEIVPRILTPITLVFCMNDFPSPNELIDIMCEETRKRRMDINLMKECINVLIYHNV